MELSGLGLPPCASVLQQLIPAVEGNTLSLDQYPAGSYLLRVEHEQGVSTAKVIKR